MKADGIDTATGAYQQDDLERLDVKKLGRLRDWAREEFNARLRRGDGRSAMGDGRLHYVHRLAGACDALLWYDDLHAALLRGVRSAAGASGPKG
jgi:hypothetical protein